MLRKIVLGVCVGLLTGGTLISCHRKGALPGDRCETNEDCEAPLVCSNSAPESGPLGVCVYPEAIPDASVVQPDVFVPPDVHRDVTVPLDVPPDVLHGC